MLYKTVSRLNQGIDAYTRPSLIDTRSFTLMQQLRIKQGVIQNFPGWMTILAAGQNLGGVGTLIDELLRFDGSRFLIVAGPHKVFKYNSVAKTLTDISGLFVFNASLDDPWWSFFYQNFLYLTNKNDGLFKTDGAGFTQLAFAPRGRVGGVLNDHLFLFNVADGAGDHPQRFQWAAEGSDTDWVAQPFNDAGQFDIVDQGDVGVGALPLGNDMVLYKERTVIPITFIGGNEVFGRRTTIEGIGLLGPYAILDIGDEHLFMGNDQFYGYRGGQDLDQTIGLKIRDYVYPQLHPVFKNRSRAIFIEEAHEAVFMFPNVKSEGDANVCVVYNIEEQAWYGPFPIDCTMTGFTNSSQTLVVDDVPDIVDTVPIIVNDFPGIAGGPLNLFSNGVGDLLEIGASQSDNGGDITRILETGDQFLGAEALDAGNSPVQVPLGSVFQVSEINLEIGDLIHSGHFQLFVGHRMELDDPIEYFGPKSINLAKHKIKISVRATGRWFRIRIISPQSRQFSLVGYQYGFNIVGRR